MLNFKFLQKEEIFKTFADACIEAEKSIAINSVTTAIMTRRSLELAVKWMYANDKELVVPYQDNISTLIHDITFKNIIDGGLFNEIKYIVKLGNFAVHNNKKITRDEVVLALNYLFNFCLWMQYSYCDEYEDLKFDESILHVENIEIVSVKEREDLFFKLSEKDKKLEEAQRENEELRKRLTSKREKKELTYDFKLNDNISEYETRKKYIDLDLKLANWDFDKNITEELEIVGMPNNAGVGYVDYVLFGDNGLPLAVVEAKKTTRDPRVGQQQAKLYADCVEAKYGQRPVIYYTNGFEIIMWDDRQYSPRKVSGFYTKNELQLLVNRRKSADSLDHVFINNDIASRDYQHEAIKSVCETLQDGHRKALLVMATGSGKTRTAISIVNVLTEKNWVKNVLFLADRTVLVKQAKNNFKKLLPNMSACNLLSSKENPEESRLVFSTYQTMINEIDGRKTKDGNILFTPGHFDLIIVDEAHRSIYKKYQAIFEYFDGIVVGLTATPRSDVDRNTYRFFEIENDVPTYAYDLEQAIKEGYLVDYHTIETSTDFMDRGIKYNELSEEDKTDYENLFEEDEFEEEISSTEINERLFNRDTIKKLLELLMSKGIKVEDGDKLGKTIIFARNHKHALKIVEVFNELYPNYKGEFAKIIDNKIEYRESLIDDFSMAKSMPQIAVSVDMLDTGVDVPEIVNLVFFKPVKSKIKFWQMIGRGTRLCKDLFGYGQDKKEFYIFDYCKNFEFFSVNEKGIEASVMSGITEKIFNYKLDIIAELQSIDFQENKDFVEVRNELINEFLNEIAKLNRDSFVVRGKIHFVEKYNKIDNWNYLSVLDVNEIKINLTPIFISSDDEENAKRFDSLIYSLQIRKMRKESHIRQVSQIINVVESLKKLGTVPKVMAQKELIKSASEEEFWNRANYFDIEEVRVKLRELIQFLDKSPKKVLYTDFEDNILSINEDANLLHNINDFTDYRKKVSKFLQGNLQNLVIYKLRHNERLNKKEYLDLQRIMFEELGSNNEYIQTFGNKNIMEVVRNIVGLEPEVAKEIFVKYTNDNKLNMKQIKFVKLVIDYIIRNGIVDMEVLQEDPFRSVGEVADVFEDNINVITNIVNDIKQINENARELA